MRIKPQESQSRAHHGGAENRQFPGSGNKRDKQVLAEFNVSRDITQYSQRQTDNRHTADGSTIQSIGQINRIGGADNDQGHERNV